MSDIIWCIFTLIFGFIAYCTGYNEIRRKMYETISDLQEDLENIDKDIEREPNRFCYKVGLGYAIKKIRQALKEEQDE